MAFSLILRFLPKTSDTRKRGIREASPLRQNASHSLSFSRAVRHGAQNLILLLCSHDDTSRFVSVWKKSFHETSSYSAVQIRGSIVPDTLVAR